MRPISYAALIAILAGCTNETQVTQPLGAVVQQASSTRYEIALLATLGGGTSRGHGINNHGWVAGFSDSANGTRHAALWRDSSITDLGTLGGLNSDVQWPGLNNGGMIVGISQTAIVDTLGESWSCAAFIPDTDKTCLGFVWEAGVMTALPTLGGDNGFATSVNSRGQVVGWAETRVDDPTCNDVQVLQFRAVLWEPRHGLTRELPPYPDDSTSAATAINEKGVAVGISGDCDVAVGRLSAIHAVRWENGTVTKLDVLAGEGWHTPMAINQTGDVVGFSNAAGGSADAPIFQAVLWPRTGGIVPLSTIPGDAFSQAFGINIKGQVVGRSCGATGCRAVLWENGVRTELHDLLVPGYPNVLTSAQDINDAGRITGRVVEASTGRTLTFVATPVPDRP
jgi:probable HAF family extracellular repeat protein